MKKKLVKPKESFADYFQRVNGRPFKKKRVRKPRDMAYGTFDTWILDDLIAIGFSRFTPKQARKLAAWLLKAADYLEQVKP